MTSSSVNEFIKGTVMTEGPVAGAVHVDDSFFAYCSGVLISGCSDGINHEITVVGLGMQDARDYFSLGSSWGDASGTCVAPCALQVWVVPGKARITTQGSPKTSIPWHRTRGG